MKKLFCLAFLAAALVATGCAVTDYPVITDNRGADSGVMQSFYDKAYIVPSSQVATIWFDGSDELYTEVTQDWRGDQWLYTYNNFDASGVLNFLDQTYCDPVRQTNCALATAWNPDLVIDQPFDYSADPSCPGWRSLSLLASQGSRIGECGSGVWADKQGLAYEFSVLDQVNFRGQTFYHLPIGSDTASVTLLDQAGQATDMPFFGRYNAYVDENLRVAIPMTPNMAHMARWLKAYTQEHGTMMNVQAMYGSLTASFTLDARGIDNFTGRF